MARPDPKGDQTKAPKARRRVFWWFREFTSAFLWITILSAVFHCPIWQLLISSLSTISNQGLLVAGLVAFGLIWLFCGNRAIWFSFFAIAYPVVWALRILPRLFAKHWPLLVIFLPGIRSILVTFRRRVAIASFAIAACIVSLTSVHQLALHISWWVLVGYLVWHYGQRFVHTYQSNTVYSQLADLLEKGSTWIPNPKALTESIEKAKAGDQNQVASNYLMFYAGSTALWYVAQKLDRLHKSSKIDLYLAASAICTVMINIAVFAIIYWSQYRDSTLNFSVSNDVTGVSFLVLSFCNHFLSDLSVVDPSSDLARSFCVIQQVFAVFSMLLVGLVFFTSCRERHSRDLELVVKKFEGASNAVGEVFERDFRMTVAAVEGVILSFSPDIARWLIKVRYGQDKAEKLINEFAAANHNDLAHSNVIESRDVTQPQVTENHEKPKRKSPSRKNTRRRKR